MKNFFNEIIHTFWMEHGLLSEQCALESENMYIHFYNVRFQPSTLQFL